MAISWVACDDAVVMASPATSPAQYPAGSGQRVSCNDVPLVMRLLTREWHALGERSMDDPEYEEAIKACL